MKWLCIAVLLAAPAGSCLMGAEGPTRLSIELAEIEWQALPYDVTRVFVGPDGRTWYEIPRLPTPELAEIKKQIAAEFPRASPQINYAKLLLLERGGRAWFLIRNPWAILGYDGVDWIIRPLEDTATLPNGQCMTRGRLIDGTVNRTTENAVWFLARNGVHRFDGEHWRFDELPGESRLQHYPIRLAVGPDGDQAFAYSQSAAGLWLFLDGRWQPTAFPGNDDHRRILHLAMPDPSSVWCLFGDGRLRCFAIGPEGKLQARDEPEDAGDGRGSRVGSLRVSNIRQMVHDIAGRLYLVAEQIEEDGSPAFCGIVVREPDGTVRGVRFSEPTDLLHPQMSLWPCPILTGSKATAWVRSTSGARLLDIRSGELIDRVPYRLFAFLHAVADDGTLFVAEHDVNYAYRGPIMVYRSGAPPSPSLHARRIASASPLMAAADDGSLWCTQWPTPPEQLDERRPPASKYVKPSLVRIAGDEPPQVVSREQVDWNFLLPGRDGVMVALSDRGIALFQGPEQLDAGGVLRVFEDHRELLAAAFGAGYLPPHRQIGPTRFMLAGTGDGGLWVLHDGVLRRLVGRRWYDAHDRLKTAGLRWGRVELLAPVGDGQTVFLSDLHLRHDGGRSFLGWLDEGQLRFTDAPHILSRLLQPLLAVRDSEGGLWLPVTKGRALETSDLVLGKAPFRITQQREIQKIGTPGWAYLCDTAGNVWIGRTEGPGRDRLMIWRDGRVVQELRIPGYSHGLLFSDRPGSVYAGTAMGLQHLAAEGPEFREYRVGTAYRIEGLSGEVLQQTQHGTGPFVLVIRERSPEPQHFLLCIEPPGS